MARITETLSSSGPGRGQPAGPFVPLHERVKRDLSERILLGEWPPGAAIPGEVELATRFGVAIGTMRKALAALVAEGMLMRRPRVGTVVTGRSPEHSLRFFFRYFRLHGADGSLLRSHANTLSITEVPASPDDAARLGLAPADNLIRIHRLRLIEEQPVMTGIFRIPAQRVPGFPRTPAELPQLLYLFLLESWGIRVTAVRETLRAELATEEDCRLLGLPDPAAVLVIEETSFDQAGQPCLLVTHAARTDRHRYVNEVR
jgi:GntR family transcriptional regulator